MKKFLAMLLTIAMVLSMVPVIATAEPYHTADPAEDDTLYILASAASNSHFFMDELYGVLAAGGVKAKVVNLYKGSTGINKFWEYTQSDSAVYQIIIHDENGKTVLENQSLDDALEMYNWDVFDMQEGTSPHRTNMDPAVSAADRYEAHKGLTEYIRARIPQAKFYYQEIFSPDIGFDNFNYQMTSRQQQKDFYQRIKEYTRIVTGDFDYDIIPCGNAYEIAREDANVGQLCANDLYHDGDAGGSYLSACVWYETLTGKSCIGNTFRPAYGLSEERIAFLQECAHQAVLEMREEEANKESRDPADDDRLYILTIAASQSHYFMDELNGLLQAAGVKATVCNLFLPSTTVNLVYEKWKNHDSDYTLYIYNENGKTTLTNVSLDYALNLYNWDIFNTQCSHSYYRTMTGEAVFEQNYDSHAWLFEYVRNRLPDTKLYYQEILTPDIGYDRGGFQMDSLEKQQIWYNEVKTYTNLIRQEFALNELPVGTAYALARQSDVVGKLCQSDGYHDGDAGGSYLSACVWFETMTGLSCVGNTFRPSYALSEDLIAVLQQSAHQTVLEMRENGDQFEWVDHNHEELTFQAWEDRTSLPTSGNYYLTGDVTLTDTVEIPAGSTLNLDLKGRSIKSTGKRIYTVNGTLNLYDCKNAGRISGATENSGAIVVSGTFDMYGGIISGNGNVSAVEMGGAISVNAGAAFTMHGGQLYNNHATKYGGAIYINGGTFTMKGGKIWSNSTTGTGANTIGGGAIYGKGGAKVYLYDGNLSENSALTGGAIRLVSGSTFVAERCTFKDNSANDLSDTAQGNGGSGGAIWLSGSSGSKTSATIRDCTFTGNIADQKNTCSSWSVMGGALFQVDYVNTTIDGCTFKENISSLRGGAIAARNDGGSLTIKNTTITENRSDNYGGAIFISNKHPLRLENTSITNNVTGGDLGAVYVVSDTSRVIVSGATVIAGNTNSATASGGNNQQDLSYFARSTMNNLLEVDELSQGAHINMCFYQKDCPISKEDVASGYVKISEGATQTDWSCGWITVYKDAADQGRNVSRVNNAFVFGHYHTDANGNLVEFKPWGETTAPTESGNYYLTKDIKASAAWNIKKDMTICFNGKVLTAATSTSNISAIQLGNWAGVTFTAEDCTGVITKSGEYIGGGITGTGHNFGSGVRVGKSSGKSHTVNWNGGAIFNCISPTKTTGGASGSAIFIQAKDSSSYPYAGVVNINGGAFYNNYTHDESGKTAATWGGTIGISSGGKVTVNGGTFYNNRVVDATPSEAVGGVFLNKGTLIINDGVFWGNSATNGGVVYNDANATLTIKGGQFYGNTAGIAGSTTSAGTEGYGGAVYSKSSKDNKITGGTYYNNTSYGTGGAFYNTNTGTKLTITGTEKNPILVKNNQAKSYYKASTSNGVTTYAAASGVGGGMDIMNGNVTMKYVHFIGNSAVNGGALRSAGGSGTTAAVIENCIFDGNSASSTAGAIRFNNDDLSVTNSQFLNNTAANGAAIYGTGDATDESAAVMNITGTKFEGNVASGNGAVILTYGNASGAPEFYLDDCVIQGNSAKNGGVFYTHANNAAQFQPVIDVINTTITDNHASDVGGVMFTGSTDYKGANVLFDGCTVTGNSAKNAGVLHLYNTTTVTLKDTQITNNWCTSGHGAINLNSFANLLYVEGNTSITDNTLGEFSTVQFNLYMRDFSSNMVSAYVAEGKTLAETAKIGVTLEGTTKRTQFYITNEGTEDLAGNFFYDKEQYQVVPYNDRVYLAQAAYGEDIYISAQQAIDAATDAKLPVKLLGNVEVDLTAAKDLTLDLNGKLVQKLTMAEGTKVSLLDSTTNDYNCDDGYGKINVVGGYESYLEDTSSGSLKRYVVLKEVDGTLSAHRVYLSINYKTLRPANMGVGFKAIFAGDRAVAESGILYGIELSGYQDFNQLLAASFDQLTPGATTGTPNQKTVVITNAISKDDTSCWDDDLYGRPFMKIGDQTIYGQTVTVNMKTMAESALASGDATVVSAVTDMMAACGLSAS